MQNNNTVTLSFRIHPNTRTWLKAASDELSGHIPALLRMLLLQAAYTQQDKAGLLGRLFGDGRRRKPIIIGGTIVLSVRLSTGEATIIKDAAKQKGMGVSEWAVSAIESWFPTFKPFYDKREEDPAGWLTDWTRLYVAKFNQASTVYAQKAGQESGKVVVGQDS
jgi:hypothetical protein